MVEGNDGDSHTNGEEKRNDVPGEDISIRWATDWWVIDEEANYSLALIIMTF